MNGLVQDHLFISYAVEDQALAKWLTLKLTAAGYRVWCDQFKLLGGESYPKDIDRALKEQTFRVLALLSRFSLSKPNPRKERTLALSIARERGCEFVIPLNVDGLRPTELDWMTSDLTFIPFHRGWADGLKQLFEKLKGIPAPQTVLDGNVAAAETFLPADVLTAESEILTTNWLEVKRLPSNVYGYRLSERPTRDNWCEGFQLRTSYRIDPTTFLSFAPVLNLSGLRSTSVGAWDWNNCGEILGVKSLNLVSSLLRRNIYSELQQKGLQTSDEGVTLFFPRGLIPQDRLNFVGFTGKRTWIRIVGDRTFKRGPDTREECSYHLSLRFTVRQDVLAPFVVELKASLHLATRSGQPLKPRAAHARRRKITRNWFNDEWLNRHLAILTFAANASEIWHIGGNDDSSIQLSTVPMRLTSPFGINEAVLKPEPEEAPDPEDIVFTLDDEEDEAPNS